MRRWQVYECSHYLFHAPCSEVEDCSEYLFGKQTQDSPDDRYWRLSDLDLDEFQGTTGGLKRLPSVEPVSLASIVDAARSRGTKDGDISAFFADYDVAALL